MNKQRRIESGREEVNLEDRSTLTNKGGSQHEYEEILGNIEEI